MGHIHALAIGPASVAVANVVLWLVGLGYAIRFRRALFAIAAVIAAAIAAIIGLHDAGLTIADGLAPAVVYWRTPCVALIVAAFVAGRYEAFTVGRGWRL